MPIRPWALACGFALLPVVASPAYACRIDRFNFVWGQDSGGHMAIRSAESCKFGIHIGSASAMQSLAIVQAPQHGTLSMVDQTHWIYKPSRGYQGPDSIVAKASGSLANSRGRMQSGDTNLTWSVDVRP